MQVVQWRIICFLPAHDQLEVSFRSFLQPIHYAVIQLLLEWWLGDIQNIELSHLGINGSFLTDIFQLVTLSDGETLHGMTRSRYHTELLIIF